MFKVTVDIYSGKPNPEFTLPHQVEQQILKEVALNKGAITKRNTDHAQLGYRGIHIDFESDYLPQFYDLPQSFSIANGASMLESKSREIAENLLQHFTETSSFLNESTIDSGLKKWVMSQIRDLPVMTFPENKSHERFEPEDSTLPCAFEKVPFEPDFWNRVDHVRKNNCYNFATNRRTDTFAQPGRAVGKMYNSITCDEVTKAAIADGSHKFDICFSENEKPRFLMALVVAPGPEFNDYHWYRQCSDGNWSHKPGQTPAKNTDNSNRVIADPSTADRGPYTDFCGYMLSPKSMKVQ